MSAQPTTQRSAFSVPSAPALRCIEIEWGVSRRALGKRAPHGNSPLITLRYRSTIDAREHWELIDPRSGSTSEVTTSEGTSAPVPEIRISGGCVHIHSPTIYAFISNEHDEPELLYARTPIFQVLGVAGGRYQPVSARLITA